MDIKERSEELKTWLGSRADEDRLAIAARAAMRALPVVWNWADSSAEAAEWQVTALAPLWANLAAWSVAVRPSGNNRELARQASAYCDQVASDLGARTEGRDDFGGASAASAGTFAAAQAALARFPRLDPAHLAALYASTCGGAGTRDSNFRFFDAALRDCALIESGTDALFLPLWHGAPNPAAGDWHALRSRKQPKPGPIARLFGSQDASATANIWLDWYQRALDGQDQPHLAQLETLSLSVAKARRSAGSRAAR